MPPSSALNPHLISVTTYVCFAQGPTRTTPSLPQHSLALLLWLTDRIFRTWWATAQKDHHLCAYGAWPCSSCWRTCGLHHLRLHQQHSLYQHQPALCGAWSVPTCFIPDPGHPKGLVYCDNWLPIRFPVSQLGLTLFSILPYISALVLCGCLYQFTESWKASPSRDPVIVTGRDEFTTYVCNWDQRLWLWLF